MPIKQRGGRATTGTSSPLLCFASAHKLPAKRHRGTMADEEHCVFNICIDPPLAKMNPGLQGILLEGVELRTQVTLTRVRKQCNNTLALVLGTLCQLQSSINSRTRTDSHNKSFVK